MRIHELGYIAIAGKAGRNTFVVTVKVNCLALLMQSRSFKQAHKFCCHSSLPRLHVRNRMLRKERICDGVDVE
jgi:hypothetical protein